MFERLGITWKTTTFIWMAVFCCVCLKKKKLVTLFLVTPHKVSLLQNAFLVEGDFTIRKIRECGFHLATFKNSCFSDGIIWINEYFSLVLSSVFLHDCWRSSTSLTIHFRVNLGPKQLNNQPIWLPCCLPAKEMNGMFMRSLGRRPHSYGNVAAARALGH